MPIRMILSCHLRLTCLTLLLLCAVGCDQTSKHLARAGLSQTSSITLPGGLVELTLAENPGAFLSLGALLPDPARFAFFTFGVGVGLVALVAYLASRARIDLVRFTGLSLVLAGGISNLLDRVFRHGLVTDFVMIHVGPFRTGIFNAADVLITFGIAVVICALRNKTSLVVRPAGT